MSKNKTLSAAKSAKNDEFYTQYADIQKEINAYLDYDPDTFRGKTVLLQCDDPEWSKFTRFFAENFERLGLKKLISTSYAAASKKYKTPYQPSLFESESPQFDAAKTEVRGKIFVLDHDTNANGRIDLDDLEWKYLEGDGDFRSEEVCKQRDEADVIVTNPPFSLFREFLAWILGTDGEGNLTQRRGEAESEECVLATKNAKSSKQFLIIGNMNATTTKDVFPLFMRNDLWMGESIHSGDREFGVPKEYPLDAAGWRVDENGNHFIRVKGVRWFTNLEHGRRPQPLELMSMEDNIRYSKHRDVRGVGYRHYDNFDALDVPYTDAIPADYDGMMGVPVSFWIGIAPSSLRLSALRRHGSARRRKPILSKFRSMRTERVSQSPS